MSKWVAWQITVCWRVRGVQQQQHRRRGATGPPAASWPGRRWVCLTPPGPPPAGCGGTPRSAAGKPQSVLRRQGRAGAGGREAGDRPCGVGNGMARLLGTRLALCHVESLILLEQQHSSSWVQDAGCRAQALTRATQRLRAAAAARPHPLFECCPAPPPSQCPQAGRGWPATAAHRHRHRPVHPPAAHPALAGPAAASRPGRSGTHLRNGTSS